MMTATILVLLDIRLLAIASGAYFKALAASRTRWRVDGFIFEAGLKALDTVAWDTPASFATSMEVLWPRPFARLPVFWMLSPESEIFIRKILLGVLNKCGSRTEYS